MAQRWSYRRIARELDVDRETVQKYLRQRLSAAKPAIAPTGSGGSKPATFPGLPGADPKPATNLPTGSDAGAGGEAAGLAEAVEVAAAPLRSPGPLSHCEPYREIILTKVKEELSAKRIWQDLAESAPQSATTACGGSSSVWAWTRSLPFRRMEVTAHHCHWRFRRLRAFSRCRFGRDRFVTFNFHIGGPGNDASA